MEESSAPPGSSLHGLGPIAFVGCGRMGGPMARRLLDAGAALRAFDVDERALRAVAEAAADAGAALLDAPVSGGVAGAEAGTLTIMLGGPAALVERAGPVLER